MEMPIKIHNLTQKIQNITFGDGSPDKEILPNFTDSFLVKNIPLRIDSVSDDGIKSTILLKDFDRKISDIYLDYTGLNSLSTISDGKIQNTSGTTIILAQIDTLGKAWPILSLVPNEQNHKMISDGSVWYVYSSTRRNSPLARVKIDKGERNIIFNGRNFFAY